MSTPEPPSADQLAAVRFAHWRQTDVSGAEAPAASPTALLTTESARRFVSTCGLLLFSPRPQHIASPAPSFVEATLGTANAAPTLAESSEARTLLARLIAEGSAVPLNLLGAPSTTPDAPDFIASAAAFPYVFTLRGDKAFKQPPSTSGATKVSPLALNTYNLLVENGPTSAYDLTTQLGKEVTEAAVLRSLNELWQNLRVLPVPQAEGGTTLWETVTNRFTKQLKAGANAGQPTALSALISLYLSQSLLATETEIETFLSPLAPRSRVRDVLHALTGAREIETIAIDGKTHLHIHGELPAFSTAEPTANSEEQGESAAPGVELAEDGTRIKKFVPKPRKVGTGYVERAKPFRSAGGPMRESRTPNRSSDRPRDRKGPPPRDRDARPARLTFNKPWDEEKQQRAERSLSRPSAPQGAEQDVTLEAATPPAIRPRPYTPKPRFGGDRPAVGRKPGFDQGDRPAYSRDRGSASEARPPRRDFAPREGGDSRPPRREFSGEAKPAFGDKKPFSRPGFGKRAQDGPRGESRAGAPDRPYTRRPPFGEGERRPFRPGQADGESRPPRRDFAPRADGASRPPRREWAPRAESSDRPPRRDFSKPGFARDRPDGEAQAATGRPARPAFRKFDAPRTPRRSFTSRDGDDSRPPRRDFGGSAKPSFGSAKPFKRSGPERSGPERSGPAAGPREGGFAGKREGTGYAGKKPFGAKSAGFAGKKPFSGKPAFRRGADAPGASTFDKFKGGNKPWGKRPPGRKPKPDQGEA